MERQRNWLSWAALALAGLALLVALGGRFGGPRVMMAVPAAPAAPAAPRLERGWERGGPPAFADELEREFARPGRAAEGFHGRGYGHGPLGRGHGPLGLLFGLFGALTRLVALGLLAWLLLRLFQQRRGGSPPAAPTTPAGHDPRVE